MPLKRWRSSAQFRRKHVRSCPEQLSSAGAPCSLTGQVRPLSRSVSRRQTSVSDEASAGTDAPTRKRAVMFSLDHRTPAIDWGRLGPAHRI